MRRQKVNQLRAGAAQATLDCANLHVANRRRFLVGEAARANQRQHFALLGRKHRQGFPEVLEIEVTMPLNAAKSAILPGKVDREW
jgi:hypothetical protein